MISLDTISNFLLHDKTILSSLSVIDYTIMVMIIAISIERIRVKFGSSFYLSALFFFIGTVLHELAHWLVALLTNGKPSPIISIIPKKKCNTLGSVSVGNKRYYNAFLIGMAPLLLLFVSYYVANNFFNYFDFTVINFALYLYLLFIITSSSMPSSIDFQNSFENLSYIIFGIVEVILIFYVWKSYDTFSSFFMSIIAAL